MSRHEKFIKSTITEELSVDSIDRKIISELEENGRTTLKDLGDSVGYTSTGIKKRMNRLVNNGIMKISALLNVETLKLNAALLLLELESGTALAKFLDQLKDCPRVINAFATLGSYNLALLIIAEDSNTLESITLECPLRTHPGIRRSDFYSISKLLMSPYLPVREHLVRKKDSIPCDSVCNNCNRFQAENCIGCPAISNYQGSL